MSAARLSVTFDERSGRYHVRWWARDAATWRSILASFKETFPQHWQCTFCTASKSWSLPLSARVLLGAWADSWFDSNAQRWDDEPEPASGRGGPQGPRMRVPATREEAYAQLSLRPDAPAGLVEAAYRWWSKELHPDRGGDAMAMVRVNRAVEVLRAGQPKGCRSA